MSESVTQEPYTTWHIIKPEAAIFTDIILEYGIDGIIAQNILDVDDYDKLSEDTTFGLIFAYKTESLQHQDNSVENPDAANIVFTYQIIDNSCATLSLVNILFNIEEYRSEFTQGFLDHTNGMDANFICNQVLNMFPPCYVTLGSWPNFNEFSSLQKNTQCI
ncbi:hypothetical protein K501DRAFT_267003 [Backusella circina FSU 941]|nr:hypothetical protein K501DRAFT_267003 [Backusella circina FSU 941]